MGLIRFLRGAKLLGQTKEIPGKSLVEHAYAANVDIPTNCTSGNCGSCMVTLWRMCDWAVVHVLRVWLACGSHAVNTKWYRLVQNSTVYYKLLLVSFKVFF